MKTPLKCVAAAAVALLGCVHSAAAKDKADVAQLPAPPAAPRMQFDTRGPTSAHVALAPDVDAGIGLYSVTGHFVRDRGARGREPIADPRGRENRVAAVGFSLRF